LLLFAVAAATPATAAATVATVPATAPAAPDGTGAAGAEAAPPRLRHLHCREHPQRKSPLPAFHELP